MVHVVTQSCCNDASCVAECPVNCIHPTPDEPDYLRAEMLYIDPDVCIDCGACVEACPVNAIVPDFDLADADLRFSEINATYFADPAHQGYSQVTVGVSRPKIEVNETGPLRVAIVGSGPAACYAAEELLCRRGLDAEVHMFERLPTPWGLARFGVAPDHQSTKAVTNVFTRTAARRGMQFHLNVEVGTHVTHDELLAHHHAVIYAVGAPQARRMNLPGEELPGSYSATDFVAWYNGHPDFAEAAFDLSAERAVIIGNGNVALDVARVLASDVDRLARTDIADHALDALAGSQVREVVVVGRRGPADAAYTAAELLGLTGFEVAVDDGGSTGDSGLKVEILRELAARPSPGKGRRIVLRFLTSPREILGEDRVTGLRVVRNEIIDGDPVHTDDAEYVECGLVLRSIGYRGVAMPGVPFDETRGILPNSGGRVVDPATGTPLTGVYTAGWIKRGPSGVIGTNKKCAADTVGALLADYTNGHLTTPAAGSVELTELVLRRQPLTLRYEDWKAIDAHERARGREHGRPRVKLVDIQEMHDVAQRAQTAG